MAEIPRDLPREDREAKNKKGKGKKRARIILPPGSGRHGKDARLRRNKDPNAPPDDENLNRGGRGVPGTKGKGEYSGNFNVVVPQNQMNHSNTHNHNNMNLGNKKSVVLYRMVAESAINHAGPERAGEVVAVNGLDQKIDLDQIEGAVGVSGTSEMRIAGGILKQIIADRMKCLASDIEMLRDSRGREQ